MYEEEEDPARTEEDYVWPTLGTAKVEQVLPSMISIWQAVPYYWEPSLD